MRTLKMKAMKGKNCLSGDRWRNVNDSQGTIEISLFTVKREVECDKGEEEEVGEGGMQTYQL